jgi:hypothetical protein
LQQSPLPQAVETVPDEALVTPSFHYHQFIIHNYSLSTGLLGFPQMERQVWKFAKA